MEEIPYIYLTGPSVIPMTAYFSANFMWPKVDDGIFFISSSALYIPKGSKLVIDVLLATPPLS